MSNDNTDDDTTGVATAIAEGIQFKTPADVDPEQEYTTTLRVVVSRFVGGGEPRIAVAGPTVLEGDTIQDLQESVFERIDRRKPPTLSGRSRGKSVDIGTVTYLGSGDVVNVEINDEFLKPSERGDHE